VRALTQPVAISARQPPDYLAYPWPIRIRRIGCVAIGRIQHRPTRLTMPPQ
jgi:hypothetical protein